MEATQKQSLIDWCDQQVAEGKELTLHWEGGNDSGWVYFEVDGETVENEYTEKLVDMMYDVLDYGSWAGDFSADGTAYYNPKTKSFAGTDYYRESTSVPFPCSIRIEVPTDVWFDSLSYEIEEEGVISVSLDIKNGFTTERHQEVEKQIEEKFDEDIDNVIEDFNSHPDTNEFRSIWENETINRSEFVQEGDKLVYTITTIDIGTTEGDDKDVVLDLSEFLDRKNDDDEEEIKYS